MAAREQASGDKLKVAIGFPGAVMLVMGGIVGVGVFVNPAVVAHALPSAPLALSAWGLGGVLAVLGAFVYAELAARLPATGGEYVYLRETYGPLAGFLFGWTALLIVQAGGQAAVAIVFAKNLDVLADGRLPERATVVGVLAALAIVNALGVKAGDRLQGALGSLKIVAILAVVVAGLAVGRPAAHAAVVPAMTGGLLKRYGAGLVPVVFSYAGWQTSAFVAGEMKDAARNLARALLVGVLGVVALYLLVNIACLHALGVDALGRTLTPTSDVLERAVGPLGGKLAAGAITLSALAFLSQGMLTAPRVSYAMARDGLFFRKLGEIAEDSRAPVAAILLQAVWTGVLALSGTYEQILSYVTAMNFLVFGVSASCLFVLRRREGADTPGGFRAPFHPWSTGLFILACAVVVAASFWTYPVNSLVGYGIALLGLPPYFYWRSRLRRERSAAP